MPRYNGSARRVLLRGVELVVDGERVVIVQGERAGHGEVARVDVERPRLERLEAGQVGDQVGRGRSEQ
eukprot:5862587-Prymnesium_polylepis.2